MIQGRDLFQMVDIYSDKIANKKLLGKLKNHADMMLYDLAINYVQFHDVNSELSCDTKI